MVSGRVRDPQRIFISSFVLANLFTVFMDGEETFRGELWRIFTHLKSSYQNLTNKLSFFPNLFNNNRIFLPFFARSSPLQTVDKSIRCYSLTTFGKVGCRAVAVIIHFTTLATFFWTNIMAWDIYKTFGQRTVLSHIRQKGKRTKTL